jgi:hypothetical protein
MSSASVGPAPPNSRQARLVNRIVPSALRTATLIGRVSRVSRASVSSCFIGECRLW